MAGIRIRSFVSFETMECRSEPEVAFETKHADRFGGAGLADEAAGGKGGKRCGKFEFGRRLPGERRFHFLADEFRAAVAGIADQVAGDVVYPVFPRIPPRASAGYQPLVGATLVWGRSSNRTGLGYTTRSAVRKCNGACEKWARQGPVAVLGGVDGFTGENAWSPSDALPLLSCR